VPTPIIEKDRCKGCELCVHACPEKGLEMSTDINAKGYFYPSVARPEDCNGCRYCLYVCPDTAVQVENKGKVTVRTDGLTEKQFTYCPGCTHGVIHRLVGEVISELGVRERTVGVAPVGCSVLAYEFFNCDMQEASHGRAMAVATGIKRGRPDLTVFTYQGDGDLASIGMAETVHTANRGEHITVIANDSFVFVKKIFNVFEPPGRVQEDRLISKQDRQAAPVPIRKLLKIHLRAVVGVHYESIDAGGQKMVHGIGDDRPPCCLKERLGAVFRERSKTRAEACAEDERGLESSSFQPHLA
jgi:NAD-dependent dihydropyrimidine dehydrogenase PreA subunit